jgi:hypothetical protein
MTAPFRVPPDPVGQQAPPARDAASAARARRAARGSLLLTTGTGDTPHDKSLRQDRCSWQQGYRAGCLGLSAWPLLASTAESWSWISGYIEGKAARVAKRKSSP